MKRNEFIRWLLQHDCVLHRNGGRHDIYINPHNGKKQPIPRHNEIDDITRSASAIPKESNVKT